MQWDLMARWEQDVGSGEADNRLFSRNRPWTETQGRSFEEESPDDVVFNQWTEPTNDSPSVEPESRENNGDSDTMKQGRLDHSLNWSHEASSDEPWLSMPTDFLTQTGRRDEVIDLGETGTGVESTIREMPAKSCYATPQDGRSTSNGFGARQDQEPTDQTSNRPNSSLSGDLTDSVMVESDWVDLKPEVYGSQPTPSAKATVSGWPMAESSKPHQTFILDSSNRESIQWVSTDASGRELELQRPQRRGPFQDQHLRYETSNTRKLKACVRCRMQKIRVSAQKLSASTSNLTVPVPNQQ
jgi:hypothetical protein